MLSIICIFSKCLRWTFTAGYPVWEETILLESIIPIKMRKIASYFPIEQHFALVSLCTWSKTKWLYFWNWWYCPFKKFKTWNIWFLCQDGLFKNLKVRNPTKSIFIKEIRRKLAVLLVLHIPQETSVAMLAVFTAKER